jgi:hypothetical protein
MNHDLLKFDAVFSTVLYLHNAFRDSKFWQQAMLHRLLRIFPAQGAVGTVSLYDGRILFLFMWKMETTSHLLAKSIVLGRQSRRWPCSLSH